MFRISINKLIRSGEGQTEFHDIPSDDISAVEVFLKLTGEPRDSDTIVKVYKLNENGKWDKVKNFDFREDYQMVDYSRSWTINTTTSNSAVVYCNNPPSTVPKFSITYNKLIDTYNKYIKGEW